LYTCHVAVAQEFNLLTFLAGVFSTLHHPLVPAKYLSSIYIRNNFAGPVFGEKRARLAPAGRQHAFIVNS
jgi:hypothetical protein